MTEYLSRRYRPAMYPGFGVYRSEISAGLNAAIYYACRNVVGGDRHVGHYPLPFWILQEVGADSTVRSVVADRLGAPETGYKHHIPVHFALHNNPSGATPLDWHSDDCKPWFEGRVEDAPPAVRIWYLPQDVPVERGPLELVPSGLTVDQAIVVPARAGDFIAVWDMGLVHRQTANVSGEPRFMVRAEFAVGL